MKKLFTILAAVLFAGSMIAGEALNTDFTQGQGDWTLNNVELDGLDYVWAQDNTYGMKATAYVNKANHATESWLISPAISLADATKAELAFSHARRYGSNDHLSVKATADGSNWTTLTVSTWPDGTNWNYVDATADLSDFLGEASVQIAFVYTSTSSAAATWEIKTVTISSEAQSDEPGDEPGDDPVEVEALTCAEAAERALAGNTDEVTVKGYVTGIVEEWSGYKNLSFWMADTQDGGQVFEAFRVVCENEADAPGVGDLVKVTGTLTKYTNKSGVTIAETTAGGSFEILEKAETGGEEQPADPVELTCAAAAEAALSVSTDNEAYNSGAKYFVRGYVTGIRTAWSNNKMTFWVADAEDGGEVLQVYNCAILSEEEAVTVGDYVQVTGKLTKFKSTPQFVAGSVCEILEKSVPSVNLGATSIAEFLEMKNSKDTCILTGVVANIVMSGEEYNQYGNFDLVDENNSDVKVFIYGLLTADGKTKQFRNMGVDAGDLLTIKAIYTEYNGNPQVQNAIFVSVVKNETTGISNTAVDVKAQKLIRDGQLYIMRSCVLYNANGAVVK